MDVCLGYVARAFGIKGGVMVKQFADHSSSFIVDKKISLHHPKKTSQVFTVVSFDGGRLFLQEIHTRNQAEDLVGTQIMVKREDLPAPASDEFYLADLQHAVVVDLHGQKIGHVVGFASNNAQDLLQVVKTNDHEISIPFIKPLIAAIDYDHKIITIDPPEGLLDIEA